MSGFKIEDYGLAEAIFDATGVSLPPSTCRAIAGQWASIKMRNRGKVLTDAGYPDQAVQLNLLAERILRGEA